jgi:hypothetical protein
MPSRNRFDLFVKIIVVLSHLISDRTSSSNFVVGDFNRAGIIGREVVDRLCPIMRCAPCQILATTACSSDRASRHATDDLYSGYRALSCARLSAGYRASDLVHWH